MDTEIENQMFSVSEPKTEFAKPETENLETSNG